MKSTLLVFFTVFLASVTATKLARPHQFVIKYANVYLFAGLLKIVLKSYCDNDSDFFEIFHRQLSFDYRGKNYCYDNRR